MLEELCQQQVNFYWWRAGHWESFIRMQTQVDGAALHIPTSSGHVSTPIFSIWQQSLFRSTKPYQCVSLSHLAMPLSLKTKSWKFNTSRHIKKMCQGNIFALSTSYRVGSCRFTDWMAQSYAHSIPCSANTLKWRFIMWPRTPTP